MLEGWVEVEGRRYILRGTPKKRWTVSLNGLILDHFQSPGQAAMRLFGVEDGYTLFHLPTRRRRCS